MKVLMAMPYFYPRVGGLENYAYHVMQELRARDWEVVVVCADAEVRSVTRETLHGSVVYRLPIWKTLSNTPVHPGWLVTLRRIIRMEHPDIVNAHIPVPYMGDMAMLAAGKLPTVVTYHTGSMRKGRKSTDWLISLYEKRLLPLALRRARAIICGSDFVRFDFLSEWTSKSVTITPGVDTGLFTPGDEPSVPGRLVFVGDFRDPRKGLDVLLQAVRRLPDVTLHVIGPGEPSPEDRVTYLGVKTGRDLVHELQVAQALILPSTTEAESFGMVLIEALACGTPVIASKIGGIECAVQENIDAILVPPNNVPALEGAIARLLGDPQLSAAMAKSGRARCEREHEWSARGSQTAGVLMRALRSAHSARHDS